MELLVAVDDYCVTKIIIAASAAGVKIKVVKDVTHDDLKKLDIAAKSILLLTSSGIITQHVSMLRYIAEIAPSAQLMGSTPFDSALVDQWLEFSWCELEVPLQLLQVLRSDICELSQTEKSVYEKKTTVDMKTALTVAENHVKSRTYFVGERLTIADISYFAVIGSIIKLGAVDVQSMFPSLFRCYMTVGSMKVVTSVVGKLPTPAVVIASSASSASKSIVESSRIDAGNFPGKWQRNRTRVKELLYQDTAIIGKEVTVQGWVRTSRFAENHAIMFVELTDGSTVKGVQLVLVAATTKGMDAVAHSGGVGASISVTGIVVASPAKGQSIEVHATVATVLGAVYGGDNGEIGGKNYPMAKKQHGLEFLREKAHLRPRSKMFSSAMRMRHAMAYATHKFFNDRGFVYTHTPLITAADCEGAGEQFVATTLLPDDVKAADIPVDKQGHVDFSKDFFGRRCCLTVSGQLNVETHACALSDVYTFGPTFRAENSHTARHLAEFWMIEPEICFAELVDDMALAEDYVRYCAAYALEHCADDLSYFENDYPQGEKGLKARLQNVVDSDFAQITYTAAVELLQKEIKEGKITFERYPNWGDDLGSEHERYLCEKIYGRPTIVINYPKGIKAFYMKLNDDNETVAAMDILVPKIGELIGGSQREDKLDVLERRCVESGLKTSDIWWYADLRRYGSVPHAGFGLGFERLIMFVTGLENIRDVIPFPRVPGHADF